MLLPLLVASSFLVAAAYNSADGVVSGTHLHFYMHDDYGGTHPTATRVVAGRSLVRPLDASIASSPRQFGGIVVFSNALTAGPGRDSPRVGTAQGHGVRVAERGTVTDLSMHLVMHDGSGSVDVKGRIDMEAKVRESTVVGGAGRFRLARGYVLTRNYGYYELGKGGTVEIDVYLLP